MIEWKDAKKNPPEKGKSILVYSREAGVAEGMRWIDGTYSLYTHGWHTFDDVTHWAELPEKPEGADEDDD